MKIKGIFEDKESKEKQRIGRWILEKRILDWFSRDQEEKKWKKHREEDEDMRNEFETECEEAKQKRKGRYQEKRIWDRLWRHQEDKERKNKKNHICPIVFTYYLLIEFFKNFNHILKYKKTGKIFFRIKSLSI